jgi:hypothetical protein
VAGIEEGRVGADKVAEDTVLNRVGADTEAVEPPDSGIAELQVVVR